MLSFKFSVFAIIIGNNILILELSLNENTSFEIIPLIVPVE